MSESYSTGYHCSMCGKNVGANAHTCPQCGEYFGADGPPMTYEFAREMSERNARMAEQDAASREAEWQRPITKIKHVFSSLGLALFSTVWPGVLIIGGAAFVIVFVAIMAGHTFEDSDFWPLMGRLVAVYIAGAFILIVKDRP